MIQLKKWILLSFTALFLLACSQANTPEQTAIRFIEHVYQGDADEAVAMIHIGADDDKAGVQDILTGKIKAMVAEAKEKADKNGGLKNVEIIGETEYSGENKQRAYVKIKVSFKKSEDQMDESVKLIKTEKDGWKIRL